MTQNVHLKGKQKLADKWNSTLYIVSAQPNTDIPVFVVRAEDGSGEKILHRNLLLPLILPWPERDEDTNVADNELSSQSDLSDDEVEVGIVTEQFDTPDDVTVDVIDNVINDESNVTGDEEVDIFDDAESDKSVSVCSSASEQSQAPQVQPEPVVEAMSPPPLRRSARPTKGVPPVRLGDYVTGSRGQFVQLDWQVRVAALLQLLPLFPLYHRDICHAIIYVISRSGMNPG